MLGRLREALIATFAGGFEPHGLEPRDHREPSVEGQPNEGPDLARAGVVPHPSNDLGGHGVSEVQPLNEVDDPGGAVRFSGILVAPLGGVIEERSVPQVAHLLPVPVFGDALEVRNKPRFEDPVKHGFLTWEGEVLGQSKEPRPHTHPSVENALPQGGGRSLEFLGGEHPVDVLCGGA
ncbi:unnamed protein product [Sphagnum jensenii]|uniref:Uncharacterized protein n=1 Tax=Sphagnum jensenii TaxID=128206 RepID=A0ABP1ANK8_9BRYO